MAMNQILKRKKAVIFDLDGTLVDSMGMWHEIDVAFLGERGIPLPPTLQKDIEGMGFSEVAAYFRKTFSLPMSVEEIEEVWRRMSYQKYRYELALKPGADAFVGWLKREGYRLGIATSNSKELAKAALIRHGMDEVFQAVVTSDEVKAGKPSPEVYLTAAERLAADPSDCLVFEDLPAGILAGKRAGMTVFAVADDFSERAEEEKRRIADGFIRDFRELLEEGGGVS